MKHAFSLVELSIVLVILGLLTGGILTGQNLIRAAELRSITTEYQAFSTAVYTFRDRYFAIPGEMRNATDFWGSAGGSGVIGDGCEAASGTGTETCNGDSDGRIDAAGGADEYGEQFTFWQHLANAGLIEGSFTGTAGGGSAVDHIPGTNAPQPKLSNGSWFVSTDISSGGAMFPVAVARDNFRLGAVQSGAWPAGKLLTPEELWNIDTKLDDGLPALGKVTSLLSTYAAGAYNCASDDTTAATYELSDADKECVLIIDAGTK